ncbi:hypothetical protein NOK12_11010, partial [Nocardioides sp. OK12]
GP